jgi:nucleotidyltransferase/DNA polymerase involved in DNA repair
LPFTRSGEDLTPYRAASKQILAVLKRYGTAEKLGLDEIFVDVTAEVGLGLEAVSALILMPQRFKECTLRRSCTAFPDTY